MDDVWKDWKVSYNAASGRWTAWATYGGMIATWTYPNRDEADIAAYNLNHQRAADAGDAGEQRIEVDEVSTLPNPNIGLERIVDDR